MLRYALRRVLWVFPSVLGVSLIAFFVLSLVPVEIPGDDSGAMRHFRFLDRPLFFNLEPSDVRSRSLQAVEALTNAPEGSAEAQLAQDELVRLGGAALPFVLPPFEDMTPAKRVRVALALAPIAERMGIEHRGEPNDPEQAVTFWNRFWQSHGTEFHAPTARSAVNRYARYGTEARALEITRLDTFALPAVMDAIYVPQSAEEMPPLRRLLAMASHVTGRKDRIGESTTPAEAKSAVERWRRWWLAFETDYVPLTGASRAAAFLLETRYGKWVFETVVLRLGKDALGRPLLDELVKRARVTAVVLLAGLALAYFLAVPLGIASAYRRGLLLDRGIAASVLVPYLLSPVLLGLLAFHLGLASVGPGLWASVLLAAALSAEPMRQQRTELMPVLVQEYIQAAIARGAGPLRVLVMHGLRNAAIPVITRATMELPVALTACFVLEQAFGLAGIGEATLQAIQHRDTGWLMTLSLCGTVWAVVAMVLTDVTYGLLDPRMRHTLMLLRRRRE
ncbi:MAG TPA: ABC transporter permease [Polyangiaceae bacterium]|nr:ABC transporter permease [Polyangiaceae bacterium]